MHTKVILKRGQQVYYIYFSRFNLKEPKTTMRCLECDRCFCKDIGKELCLHHVACDGAPKAPPKDSLKQKLNIYENEFQFSPGGESSCGTTKFAM